MAFILLYRSSYCFPIFHMTFSISIENRDYSSWSLLLNDIPTQPPLLGEQFCPIKLKLFHGDTFHITNTGSITCKRSCFCETTISHPGILVLTDNQTYGRTENKKRLLYKCIPNDYRLPVFLVPYEIKLELSKHIVNKYVLFKYSHWNDIHPRGELVEIIGAVNIYDAFENYQLYCKGLNTSIAKYTQHMKTQLAQTCEDFLCQTITEKYCPEDRTSEYIFSIDNETTTDYDDALSITKNPEDGSIRISVYISNVLVWLQELNGWSHYAERVSTIYLPTRKIPMIPIQLSENLCSLIEKTTRFSIAMDCIIYPNGTQIVLFRHTKIIVKKNYRYESEKLLRNPRYQQLFSITQTFDSSVKDSHEVVSYWMIRMNAEVGSFLYNNGVGIFRSLSDNMRTPQPETSTGVCGFFRETTDKFNKMNVATHMQEMERLLYNLHNHICSEYKVFSAGVKYEHSELMLENYVHFTSPIRRLVDLLNQIYLWSLIGNIMTKEMREFLDKWISSPKINYINEKMRAIRRTQTTCELVHMCYLHLDIEKVYTGIVVEKRADTKQEYTVYIKDLKYLGRIKCEDDIPIRSKINCRIFVFQDKTTLCDKIVLRELRSDERSYDFIPVKI